MTKDHQSFEVTQGQTLQVTVNVDASGSTTAQSMTGATLGFWLDTDVNITASSDADLIYPNSDMSLVNVDGTNDGIGIGDGYSDISEGSERSQSQDRRWNDGLQEGAPGNRWGCRPGCRLPEAERNRSNSRAVTTLGYLPYPKVSIEVGSKTSYPVATIMDPTLSSISSSF